MITIIHFRHRTRPDVTAIWRFAAFVPRVDEAVRVNRPNGTIARWRVVAVEASNGGQTATVDVVDDAGGTTR